jgi:hypothetical protein
MTLIDELCELADLSEPGTRLHRALRAAAARIEALELDLGRARSTIQVAQNALNQASHFQRMASTAYEDARCELKSFALEDLRRHTVPCGGDSAKATKNVASAGPKPESEFFWPRDADGAPVMGGAWPGDPRLRCRCGPVEATHDDQRCESCMEVPRDGECGCTHVRVPDGIVVEALQAVFPGFVPAGEAAHDAPCPGSTPDVAPEVEFMRELASTEGVIFEETLRHAKEEVAAALEGWADDACQALDDWAGLGEGAVLPPGMTLSVKTEVRRIAMLRAGELMDAADHAARKLRG